MPQAVSINEETAHITPAEIAKIKAFESRMVHDFPFYADKVIRIVDKEKRLIPLRLNPIQMLVQEIKAHIKKEGRLVRLIIDKARQFGLSTEQLGENFHFTTTNPNTTTLFVSHDPPSTKHLFEIVKRMYDKIPDNLAPEWKPDKKRRNGYELAFDDIDSTIRVGTAGSDNLGSSQTINRLHLSEASKYPAHSASTLLTSLLQTVPKSDPDSEVVVESTANGVGGEYHDMYFSARYRYYIFLKDGVPTWRMEINIDADPDNEYSSLFIPCFAHEKYRQDPPLGFVRTKEEEGFVKDYGVGDEFLQWRRHTIANECKGNVSTFHQEYPMNERESFLTSGRPVFDNERIQEKIKKCIPPRASYVCTPETGLFASAVIRSGGDTTGLLQVWEEPRTGVAYVISADVSEGLEIIKRQTDFSSVDVVEQLTGKQVAHFHGKIDPVQLGMFLYYLGLRYNKAWVVPERNNHGTATVGKLFEMHYQHLYSEEQANAPHRPIRRYGFLTHGGKLGDSKALVIDNLVELVNKDADGIQCADTYREMLTFKHSADGKLGGEVGCFDDRVSSISIAAWTRKRLPLPSTLQNSVSSQQQIPVSAFT